MFSPVTLGPFSLPNRWVLAPMTTYSSHPDGTIAPEELVYLERRSRAGFALVMTAACYVHPSGHAFPGQWSCASDEFLPSLQAAVEAVRRGGGRPVLQIHHGGRQCPSRLCGQPVSASAIPSERPGAEVPRELSEDEIEELVAAFGAAARRAEQAGFWGVEIHGANTYLLQQFVSPHSNRRTDRWGRDRLLFSRRVVESVLSSVSPGFPVGYRFSPEEHETPGLRLADTERLIAMLLEYPLAWLHVSLRHYAAPSHFEPEGEPMLSRIAGWIGGRTPLIGVGSIRSLEDAERARALGADLVAVGRAAITEPDFPWCLLEGRPPRLLFPRHAAEEKCVLPPGLVARILGAPGWFDLEEDEAPPADRSEPSSTSGLKTAGPGRP